jgi:hypothetical protein
LPFFGKNQPQSIKNLTKKQSDLHQTLWNMYLDKIDALSVIPDEVSCYQSTFKMRQSNLIDIRFAYKYVKFTYVEQNKYFSLASQVSIGKKSLPWNHLELKMPFFGLSFENSKDLPILRIVVKMERCGGEAIDRLNSKMIRHLIGAHSVLRNECSLLADQIAKNEVIKTQTIERVPNPTPKFLRGLAEEEEKEKVETEPVAHVEMTSNFERVKVMTPTEKKVGFIILLKEIEAADSWGKIGIF